MKLFETSCSDEWDPGSVPGRRPVRELNHRRLPWVRFECYRHIVLMKDRPRLGSLRCAVQLAWLTIALNLTSRIGHSIDESYPDTRVRSASVSFYWDTGLWFSWRKPKEKA